MTAKKPAPTTSSTATPGEESSQERERRLAEQIVGPEDEERKSPGGPKSQVAPDVEPAGS